MAAINTAAVPIALVALLHITDADLDSLLIF